MQRLLAIIAAMIASIGGGKAAKPNDFAPWLNWEAPDKEPVPFEETLEGRAMDAIIKQAQERREQNGHN